MSTPINDAYGSFPNKQVPTNIDYIVAKGATLARNTSWREMERIVSHGGDVVIFYLHAKFLDATLVTQTSPSW